ncbi:MAG: hypothetical protein JW888_08305, partial [Pirellulales bacterium]|nr:hypothetical protein [Pirellulales bacterium]
MSITWKLAFSYAARHPMRMVLTSLAMVTSACIVVWVVSGYDALASQFGRQASGYLGRYDFFVVPEDPNAPSIDTALVAELRADQAVAEVAPVAQLDARLMNPNAGPGGFGAPGIRRAGSPGRRAQPSRQSRRRFFRPSPRLVGTDATTPPHALVEGRWIDPEHPDRR